MAEVGTILASIQLSLELVHRCKFYIEALQNAPSELRQVLIEASTFRLVLDRLDILVKDSFDLKLLEGEDGTLERSRKVTESLLELFPEHSKGNTDKLSFFKRKRDGDDATARERFKWAWNKKRAEKLLKELRNYRGILVLVLDVDSV